MKKIVWLIIGSLAIRLIGLNQSLWLDEAISAKVAKDLTYTQIIKDFSPNDFHPPTYYLMLKGWTGFFGNSEISLRMPSILFTLVTVYIVYLLGGIWPAALVGFNPLLVYYSQEARMYSMVTMLLTLCLYCLVKKRYVWVSVLAGLSFLTFYGSVFFLAAMTLYLLLNKKYKEVIITNIGPAIALLIIWPLMKLQLHNSQEMLSQVTNWSLVLGKANLKNLLLIPMKFTSGRISFEPKAIYYLVSGGFAILVFKPLCQLTLTSPLEKGRNTYQFIFWMTLVIGTIFSIFTPMLQYFRFLYLIPVMGLIINKNKLILGGFIVFSLVYLLNPVFYREDWKSLAAKLPNKVYMISSFGDPVKYYVPKITFQDSRTKPLEKEITVVPYGEEIHGFNHNDYLTKLGYKKVGETDYRGVTKEDWHLIY